MSQSTQRYRVVKISQSAHCCFVASVVDSTKPDSHTHSGFESICECFEVSDAKRIAGAMNEKERRKHG